MTMYELKNAVINSEMRVENVYYSLETLKRALEAAKVDGTTVHPGVVERVVADAIQTLAPLVIGAKQ